MPLSAPHKLGNPDFPLPFSFIYGEFDWVYLLDEYASRALIRSNKYYIGSGEKPANTTHGQLHIVPTSDHNMHMDNSIAFTNLIINDLVEGANEPVLTVEEYATKLNLL